MYSLNSSCLRMVSSSATGHSNKWARNAFRGILGLFSNFSARRSRFRRNCSFSFGVNHDRDCSIRSRCSFESFSTGESPGAITITSTSWLRMFNGRGMIGASCSESMIVRIACIVIFPIQSDIFVGYCQNIGTIRKNGAVGFARCYFESIFQVMPDAIPPITIPPQTIMPIWDIDVP